MLNKFLSALILTISVLMLSSASAANKEGITFNGQKYEFVGHKTEDNMSSTLYFHHRKSTKEPHSQITAMYYKADATHSVTDVEFFQFIRDTEEKGLKIHRISDHEFFFSSSESEKIDGITVSTLKITYMAKDKQGNMPRIEYKETLDADAQKALLVDVKKNENAPAKKIEKIMYGLIQLSKELDKKA